MKNFEKISQVRFKGKSSMIAEQILQMIRGRQYSVGSKLPPERIIAEQMGVSRPSVREAISALQIVGVLETHPGDGTYVKKPLAGDNLSSQVQTILEQSDSPYEILEARKAIEAGVIRQAIKVATESEIEKIEAAWKKKREEGRRKDYDAYTKKGKDLHLAIAEATQNTLIVAIMDRLLSVTNQPLWRDMRCRFYEQNPGRIDPMMDVHQRMVSAIKARDAEKAIRALEEDLDTVLQQLYNMV